MVPAAVRQGQLASSRLRMARSAGMSSGRDWDIAWRHGQTVDACVDAIAAGLARADGGIVLLHDFLPFSEFRPAGLAEEDLDLRIIEITRLLIERIRGAGFSFAPTCRTPRCLPRLSCRCKPTARSALPRQPPLPPPRRAAGWQRVTTFRS